MLNMKKRLFHVLLSIALMFSMIPTVLAEGNEAKVGETEYATLQGAIDAAASGAEIVLLKDVSSSEIITLDKAITLDGNGKTLTSTAGRAINIGSLN